MGNDPPRPDAGPHTVATRVMPAGPVVVTARPPTATQRTLHTPRTAMLPESALRDDESARAAIFARLMLTLGVIGIGILFVADMHPVARAAFAACLAIDFATYSVVAWISSRPERWSQRIMGVSALAASFAADALIYSYGVFSPAPMVSAVAIYAMALGGSGGWALAGLLSAIAGHVALVVLITQGVLPDHGMQPADALSPANQVLFMASILTVYVLAHLLGRWSYKKSFENLSKLERAVRQVAERDALLAEMHQQLDDAAGLGAPGRFSEHVLGSFKLGVVIGRGGMGEVYEAVHVETGAIAAVKLLARDAVGDPAKVARFVRELEIARTLRAPNVARVLEVGDLGADLPYLAMERLVGKDLAEVLRDRRRLPLGETVELVRQVAAGLGAAHAAGIVHRDLKPSNVFAVISPGAPVLWKVLDFGVSKLAGEGTLTGNAVVGTPGYMAPEQARGAEADARADVYALAAIAYRALTGRSLFGTGDLPALLYRVVHTMPARPGDLGAPVADDVEAVLAVGLAKDPRERFASAAELAGALAAAAEDRLGDDVRARSAAILAARPWGSERPA